MTLYKKIKIENNRWHNKKKYKDLISDRWDLTLECIRRYYNGEDSPLYNVFLNDKAFFDLFVDFKGYVDFFPASGCCISSV